jgi:ketosteroid isomerase-like protein
MMPSPRRRRSEGDDVADSELERNKRVVRQQIEAMEHPDAAAQAALMTDDVKWWVPPSSVDVANIPRPLEGKQAVTSMLGGAGAWYSELHWTVDRLIAEDDHVAAAAYMRGVTASGNDYQSPYAFVYRIVDGKIAEVWEHADTAYAYSRTAG